ncbi:MAG: zinc-binding dehydrogenase [Chloroflexi bacterium]|uniref:Zinc-binding dehydrogenase n=1 Tax=Candidatus Chlorohelix allophototropha TaxID=3003348 RepID=A0A8T7LR73_9CHLR|nr:zinc-binding dehydrogenase [Chloroflexota bacterium]WJW66425.1 zinc-binding dehydrogenase [Chloroflexota bacterium L227-S17]
MIIRTAQAIVVSSPNRMTFSDVRLRELAPEEVLIRTLYTSISAGTERLLMAGQLVEMANLPFPCIPGYETVGEIVEVGAAVSPNYVGELAFVGGSYGYEGVTPAWGGQASYITTHYSKAYLLNGLDPVAAVAIAPAATAWHGVELIDIKPGELVLVMGQGPIGQLAAQAAKLKGAELIVCDTVQDRLDKAIVGDIKVNITTTSLKSQLPAKVDVMIDATGKMEVIGTNVTAMRDRGRVLLLGFYRRIDLDFAWPFLKELSFHTSREWAVEDVPAVMNAMHLNKIQTGYLFTHRYPVTEYQEAYASALHNPYCLKALINWQ